MGEPSITAAAEPAEWFVVFQPEANSRLFSALACGRFKHVSAFAYIPGFKVWLFYDVAWSGTRLVLSAKGPASAMIERYVAAGCSIVRAARTGKPMGLSSRIGFFCVPAVKHLLGLRTSALRPDALYRHLLANGGTLANGTTDNSSRSDAPAGADAGAE